MDTMTKCRSRGLQHITKGSAAGRTVCTQMICMMPASMFNLFSCLQVLTLSPAAIAACSVFKISAGPPGAAAAAAIAKGHQHSNHVAVHTGAQ
jgi:hypothetical protein